MIMLLECSQIVFFNSDSRIPSHREDEVEREEVVEAIVEEEGVI